MSKRKQLIITGMSGLVAVAFLAASPAAANSSLDSVANSMKKVPGINRLIPKDRVKGTVSTVTGTTIVLDSNHGHASTTVRYTIDASNAVVYKSGATSTLSAVRSGDKIMVKGTISGTNVAATTIVDGAAGGLVERRFHRRENASSTEAIRGKFTLGSVTAVNGTSFTIADKGHKANATTTIYTVITDNSTVFKKAGQSASLSDVTVGQFVMVAGAKNSSGDTITATGVNVVTRNARADR